MVLGVLQLSLRLPEVHSLKEKRWHLKSLITKIRKQFNVSISEVESQDAWQWAVLAIAHVGTARSHTNRLLDQILNFVRRNRELELVDSQLEFY